MFKVLLAASPSFNNAELFSEKLDFLLCNKQQVELHYLTQKVFTKICNDYVKRRSFTGKVQQRDFIMEGKETTRECYNRILDLIPDAAVVFWDGETFNEKMLIYRLQKENIKHRVIPFESIKQQLAKEKIEKKGRKKITVPITKESKERYCAAHEAWFAKEYPTAYKNGLYAGPKIPVINSGSRMDFFIVNFIVWSGWSATKVSVLQKVKGQYIASGAKTGTFDLTATIKGKSVKIETKHRSDTPSNEQLKMQLRERSAGAIAEFVYSIEDFFRLYDKIVADN